jgi:hypothetical protein
MNNMRHVACHSLSRLVTIKVPSANRRAVQADILTCHAPQDECTGIQCRRVTDTYGPHTRLDRHAADRPSLERCKRLREPLFSSGGHPCIRARMAVRHSPAHRAPLGPHSHCSVPTSRELSGRARAPRPCRTCPGARPCANWKGRPWRHPRKSSRPRRASPGTRRTCRS